MTDGILSLLGVMLSSGCTLLICILNNNAQAKRIQLTNQVTLAELKLEITSLKEEQAKHNSVIERVYHLEQTEGINEQKFGFINEQIKSLQHRKDN